VFEAMDVGQAADVDLLGLIGVLAGADAVDVVEVVVEDEEGIALPIVAGGFGALDEGMGELGGGELGVRLLGEEGRAEGGEHQEGAEEG